MKHNNIFLILAIMFANVAFAQQTSDEQVFKAMQTELNRNVKQLQLDSYGLPLYLDYSIAKYKQYEIEANLGSIIRENVTPITTTGAVNLITGTSDITSEIAYGKKQFKFPLPSDLDYDVLRKKFWIISDYAYKYSVRMLFNKLSYLKTYPRNEEYTGVKDFSPLQPTTKVSDLKSIDFDKAKWEQNLRDLSAIFKDFPKIFNSNVYLSGVEAEFYLTTSEGTKIKIPHTRYYIEVRAFTRTDENDGVEMYDNLMYNAATPDEFPSMEKLTTEIREFAETLCKLSESKPIEEFYSGPIMFEGAACMNIFTSNLIKQNALINARNEEGRAEKNLENRFGKKIIDSRFTVKNYSTLNKYNGTKLLGAYEIDGEGVVPQKELLLVENGLLRNFLNGRVPTPKSLTSTGSAKFSIDNLLQTVVAPGTIHIAANKGTTKHDAMKKALLKAAKEEGLDYAYIVRKMAGRNPLVYRLDKDGKETLVRDIDLSEINLQKIKRLLNISNKELVSNYVYNNGQSSTMASIIYPAAIIVEDVEISKYTTSNKQKAFSVKHPLLRK